MEPLLDPRVDDYLADLVSAQHHDPVLVDIERRAAEVGPVVIGRAAGRFLELTVRLARARDVVDLGAGLGYAAYWLARGVGGDGRVACVGADHAQASLAERYLRRAQLWDRVGYRVADPLDVLAELDGVGDVVHWAGDPTLLPRVWELVADGLEPGGLFLCQGGLAAGAVVGLEAPVSADAARRTRPEVVDAVRHTTREVVDDPRYVTSLVPVHDGILVAHRVG